MIAAILIAASLQSTQLGEFFTLPEWMPDAVASTNTPGSDPSAGGGWYVDEYTNGWTFSAWKVYDGNGDEVQGYAQPSWDDEDGCWYIPPPPLSSTPPNSTFYGVDYETVTDKNITDLEFHVEYMVGSGDDAFLTGIGYTAHRDKERTLLPTGRKLPRNARLTPEIKSALNSTFEAYCERAYYASQGQSNVWDTTVYGSTGRRNFDFSKVLYRDTFPDFFFPTNRTVTTRRLDEYRNIKGEADDLVERYVNLNVQRPGWIMTYLSSDNYHRFRWSTTGGGLPDSFIPTFSWRRNYCDPTLWNQTCATFKGLTNDDVWGQGGGDDMIPEFLYDLSFGQPEIEDELRHERCAWTNSPPITMAGVIVSNYPHANPFSITNDTHRLVSYRLCCMNQVLGLMDRTYHVPEIEYVDAGTNFTFHNSLLCTGTGTATVSRVSVGYEYTGTIDPKSIVWGADVMTNSTVSTGGGASDECRTFYVSGTGTDASAQARIDRLNCDNLVAISLWDVEQILLTLGMSTRQTFEMYVPLGDISMVDDDIRVLASVYGSDGAFVATVTVSLTLPRTLHIPVNVYYTYARSHSYGHSFKPRIVGATQPGFQSGDRAAANRFGCVRGLHWKWGELAGNYGMTWSDSRSSALYASSYETYTTRASLETKFSTRLAELTDQMDDLYGLDPADMEQVIPINQSDADRVRNSVGGSASLGVSVSTNRLDAYYIRKSSGDTVTAYKISQTSGTECATNAVSFPLSLTAYEVEATLTNAPVSQVERASFVANGKIGVITRTDWDWKAIKRTDN